MRSEATEVLVIGAGVAGCATALALGERHAVTLVDRGGGAATRIGESLPGAAGPLLRRLGLMERFLAGGHRTALGKASAWGSDVRVRRDGFLDPHGPGWCLDRPRFDTMLRDAAGARGARLLAPASLATLTRRAEGAPGWRAVLQANGEDVTLDARFVVLAHGRGAPPIRLDPPLAVRPRDRLVCRYVHLEASATSRALAGFSLIEAVAEGWWYQATLPDGRRLLAYHTDADLPSARRSCHADGFADLLRATRALDGASLRGVAAIGRASARSQALDRACGADWCAVGDAACAFDPLSSQGLFHALYTGVRGAEAVALALRGDERALPAYGARIDRVVAAYGANLAGFYGLETRFAELPFWSRRRGRVATSARDRPRASAAMSP